MSRPTAGRVVLCLAIVVSWVETWLMVSPWDHLRHPVGPARWVPMEPLLSAPGIGLLTLAHVGLTVAFLARWRESAVGWALLGLLGVEGVLEMSTRDIFMPHLGAFIAGDVLLGWLVGLWLGARRGLEGAARDHFAQEVVIGALGAMLTWSALSKLIASGVGWVDGGHQCTLIYEHAITAGGPLAPMREAISRQYGLCAAGSAYTLLIELVSFLLVWPRARKAQAVGLCLMFLALGVTTGIHEYLWPGMVVMMVWSTLGERPAA